MSVVEDVLAGKAQIEWADVFSLAEDGTSIRVPTHIIAGENDASTPPALMQGFSAIPGATFDVIEGAPHMVSLEKPAELAEDADAVGHRREHAGAGDLWPPACRT